MKYILILSIIFCSCSSKLAPKTSFVPDYLNDYAQFKGHLPILPAYEIQVLDLPTANGKATKIGDKWIIQIDTEFDRQFHGKPQMKRLQYHEFSHVLLWKVDSDKPNDVMNPELVYKPMKESELKKLFTQNQ